MPTQDAGPGPARGPEERGPPARAGPPGTVRGHGPGSHAYPAVTTR
jgi:hypothetical protein